MMTVRSAICRWALTGAVALATAWSVGGTEPEDGSRAVLTSIRCEDSIVTLRWNSMPGALYAVEFVERLGAEWQTLAPAVASDGPETDFHDNLHARFGPHGCRAGFYRIRKVPTAADGQGEGEGVADEWAERDAEPAATWLATLMNMPVPNPVRRR